MPGITGAGVEVSKRIELWERSEFEALLQRCEQQQLLNQKHEKCKRQPQHDDAAGRGARGVRLRRMTSAEGAHSQLRPQLWHPRPLGPRVGGVRLQAMGLTAPAQACGTRLLQLLAPQARAQSISLTYLTPLAELTPTRSTGLSPACSSASLVERLRPPPAGSLTRVSAGSARRVAPPEPVRMGEFLRSAYAKRLVSLAQARLRPVALNMHQWGGNLPGEALGHWRAPWNISLLTAPRSRWWCERCFGDNSAVLLISCDRPAG